MSHAVQRKSYNLMYGIIFIHNYKSKKQRSVKIKIRSFDKIFKNTKIALYQQKNRPKIFYFWIGFFYFSWNGSRILNFSMLSTAIFYLSPNFFSISLGIASLCTTILIVLCFTNESLAYQIPLYLLSVPQEFFTR